MNTSKAANRFLTTEQAEDLAEHLKAVLSADQVHRAVSTIDREAGTYSRFTRFTSSASQKKEWRRFSRARYKHMCAVEETASNLRTLLLGSDLKEDGSGRPMMAFFSTSEWSALDTTLTNVVYAAQRDAYLFRPPERSGRPPDEWRDRLIDAIFGIYPDRGAKKSRGSHFERTVEMVLQFVGRDIADVHDLVVAALARRQVAPDWLRFPWLPRPR